jgi:hypothetical protein
VTVTYKRSEDRTVTNNEMATVSARPFSPIEANRYAGALGDPARMAQNFAGVSTANDTRNDIVVRGNSPASLLWRLDGVNIPNPNHYGAQGTTGGPVRCSTTTCWPSPTFLTGAFPAEYANALGSVFDLRLRKGNDEKREFLGQVGFNGLEVGAEGPFSKSSKGLLPGQLPLLAVFAAQGRGLRNFGHARVPGFHGQSRRAGGRPRQLQRLDHRRAQQHHLPRSGCGLDQSRRVWRREYQRPAPVFDRHCGGQL